MVGILLCRNCNSHMSMWESGAWGVGEWSLQKLPRCLQLSLCGDDIIGAWDHKQQRWVPVNVSLLLRGYVAKFGYKRNRGRTVSSGSQKQEGHQPWLFLRRSRVAGVPPSPLPPHWTWHEGGPCLCQAGFYRGPNVGTVMKHPDKGSLREKGFFWLTDQGDSPLWWGSQGTETSGPIVCMIRSREKWRVWHSSPFPLTQSRILSREWWHPQWTELPTSINIIMTMLHGHAQRPISKVSLDFFVFVSNTNHHTNCELTHMCYRRCWVSINVCVCIHVYVAIDLRYIFIKYAFLISVYNWFPGTAIEKYHKVWGLHNRTRP